LSFLTSGAKKHLNCGWGVYLVLEYTFASYLHTTERGNIVLCKVPKISQNSEGKP